MGTRPGDLQLRLQRLVMGAASALDADAAFIALWAIDGTLLPLPSIDSHIAASCGLNQREIDQLERDLNSSGYSFDGVLSTAGTPGSHNAHADSGWAVPIGRGDGYQGFLSARHRGGKGFPARDVLLLKTLAEAAETAIDAALAADHARTQEEGIQALLDIAKEISTLGGLDRALGRICAKASQLMSAEIAYVALADTDQQEIRMRMTHGIHNPEWNTMRMAFGEGIGGLVAQQREAVIVRDYESYEHQTRGDIRRMAADEGLRAVLAAPMITGHRVLGVLFIADRRPARFDENDARLLQGLADHAAIAIANSRLYEGERRELEVHDQLTSIVLRSGDYTVMAEALHALVGNPVALYDSHLNLLSFYPSSLAADLADELEHIKTLVRSSNTEQDASHSTQLRPRNGGYILAKSPELGVAFPCAIAPAVSGDRVLGYVQIVESDRYLQDYDLRVAERAGVILALRMMTERVEAEVEQRLRGDLVSDLLSTNAETVESAATRFSHLGNDPNGSHVIVVIDTQYYDSLGSHEKRFSADQMTRIKQRLFQRVSSTLEAEDFHALVALKSNRVVAVVRCPSDTLEHSLFIERLGHTLADRLAECQLPMTVLIGSGTIVKNAMDLRRSYEEAVLCLRAGADRSEKTRFVTYDELGIVGVILDSADSGRLSRLVRTRLGELLEYDKRHRAQLVHTLSCYLDVACNKAETAHALNVHLSTLKYRLRRIEEISGNDLADPRARLETQLACHALKVGNLFRTSGH